MKKTKDNLKPFRQHLVEQYGELGSDSRNQYEAGFEAFKLGAILLDLRHEAGLTQEQLASKCGTSKSYISRIENDASDIRLSTIIRIIRQGFGKQLRLTVN